MPYIDDVSQFVLAAAKLLVGVRTAVSVTVSEDQGHVLVTLNVAQEDVGRLIGKNGKTVHALRLILAAASQASGVRTVISIQDPHSQG